MNAFAERILRWYAENGRDLPWRRTRDPYAVWLSEIILQQTRIAQGTAYWHRFMERFPTAPSLAAATEDEVLRLWEGLGYYSRARNLHAAARQIAEMGHFPDTLEGIRALKGVGDYTAAAIGSICFNLPAAVLDGNVYRVLARHFGIATPIGTTAAKKEFTALADKLLPAGQAGAYNQGMMDFGAIQCTPRSPACMDCPLQESCEAFRSGRVELLPVKQTPRPPQVRHFSYVYLRCDGYTAIRRRGAGDIWQGLWEPYALEDETPSLPGLRLLQSGVKHVLTHRILLTDFYFAQMDRRPELPDGYRWIPESELDRYGKSRLFELLLEAVATLS
ncbi:MAG: A/G-specific adenine glycosylase [Bacteroidales bacterium]|nr:A/G-specific adenine glycosylase [Bacteroidales bacterium]